MHVCVFVSKRVKQKLDRERDKQMEEEEFIECMFDCETL